FAVTFEEPGVPPIPAISCESAIEKQAAWAAAISSSGLVLPSAASVRLAQVTGSGPAAPLAKETGPEPSARPPCQAGVAVERSSATRRVSERRATANGGRGRPGRDPVAGRGALAPVGDRGHDQVGPADAVARREHAVERRPERAVDGHR